MKKKKFISLPVTFTEIKDYSFDDSLIPVDIKVMHDGLNLNNSTFYEQAINDAKETLKNKPILGYIKKIDGSDSKDFAGHEVEMVLGDEGLKVIYLERPIGTIPETNNYSIQEENGKKYVSCRGYLWKEYLNEGYEILKDNPEKSVSMEITADDYKINDDGTINITKYRYLGVTVLGESVSPAMEGANLSVVGQFSEKFTKEYYERMEQLNKNLKEFKNEQLNEEENDKGGGGEIVKKNKFTTYNEKREVLRNALNPIVIRDDNGVLIEETRYWIMDFDDNYIFVERDVWKDNDFNSDYGRFAYTFDEKNVTATISDDFKEVFKTWLTLEEKQKVEEERNNFTATEQELKDLKGDYEALKTEKMSLQEYKNNIEKNELKEQQKELFSKYDEYLKDVLEYQKLKDDKDNYSISDIEKECALLYVNSKTNFSKNVKKNGNKILKINIENQNKNVKESPYGDLF